MLAPVTHGPGMAGGPRRRIDRRGSVTRNAFDNLTRRERQPGELPRKAAEPGGAANTSRARDQRTFGSQEDRETMNRRSRRPLATGDGSTPGAPGERRQQSFPPESEERLTMIDQVEHGAAP